ncbi:hypothetical protein CCAX7_55330 [Capsulimonas corticalis]|uniref:Uncharacterized protein n=1 Tax=Capsulimonas corticalis TaxID=2219043 RepID=A0A402D5M5_9BACT|nr:hypothetical protein [Capsulimonas corticalis]BDI33482.1 hypothetical protein CCAX7_55330 [Capsulimonas corticalis]
MTDSAPGKKDGGAARKRPSSGGRYRALQSERLKELAARHAGDLEPLDLLPELALLRALLTDYVERYDRFSAALIAWHESFGNPERPAKPVKILDVAAAGSLLAQVGTLALRIEKQKSAGAIGLAALDAVMGQMGAALVQAAQETIDDDDTRTKLLDFVERRWGAIDIQPQRV